MCFSSFSLWNRVFFSIHQPDIPVAPGLLHQLTGVCLFYPADVDEASKKEIKDILIQYDRSLLVADPRRCESKKFGGPGPRARYQKSYR